MSGRRARALFALALLLLLLLPACGTVGLSLDELPADPIAVTYWEGEDARRRAELMRDEVRVQVQKQGVARVESIAQMLGAVNPPASVSRYPGRLAFIDPGTARVTPVAQIPRGAVPLAWRDGHQRLLFLSSHRGGLHAYEYDRRTDEVRALTAGRQSFLWADFGRGSQLGLLEVVTEQKRRFERVSVSDESTGRTRFVFEDRNAESFRLSPDGRTLLYVHRPKPPSAGADRPWVLVALDLETGEERLFGPGREPSFSPTGDWIVYSAPFRDGWRLRRMRSDGSARSPVSAGIRDEKMPSISPDGQFVVYVGETTGLDRLFVRRIDGSGDRILLDAGAVFAPVW
jgi:Tol biopolymer transport system component